MINRVWDGSKISIFGGRNEVVAFNVILEAGNASASRVSVSLKTLTGSGANLTSIAASGNGVFNWTQRPIELFYVRYLQIKGLSAVFYETYDERHIPQRLRRPWSGQGAGSGSWQDRPDHDKYYPDIAVPLELVPSFTIAAGHNQSIWADVYIPRNTPAGLYKGSLTVQESGGAAKTIPVELTVYGFTLPDVPTAKTMLYFSSTNINRRYLDSDTASGAQAQLIRDRHFLLAHRHKISLIGDTPDNCNSNADQPCPEWLPRLDGSLFTATNGYDGPGVNTGNGVYAIGTYGSWSWSTGTEADMHRHADAWVNWFERNAPTTDYFLYLIDESANTAQTEMWSRWILSNSGPGKRLRSLATLPLPTAAASVPSLDIPTSTLSTGIEAQWQPLADRYTNDARKRFYAYNGHRPATGSFGIEDDGVALRELAWAHYKKHINRWLYWESTYYNNYQGNTGQVNVFQTAQTFGNHSSVDPVRGETGGNYSNGDGVLFYPGTDRLYAADSYGVDGPFASLRFKDWRRGIQDVDYLAMAAATDPKTVQDLVNRMVPKALWEYGVSDTSDPTWVRTDISWSIDPDQWEVARAQLAVLLAKAASAAPPVTTTSISTALAGVVPAPNPWRADRHAGSPITFLNLPAGSTLKVFAIDGHLVKTLNASAGGNQPWDLTNDAGEKVASGIYLYLVSTPDGQHKRGKFGIIR